jgi:F-type H+-transporting ATPase subunit b
MRRITLGMVLILGLAMPCAWGQREPAGERAAEGARADTEGEGGMQVWAWLNFALLTGGLVWVFRKNAGPFFVSRAIGIRRGMLEAEDARMGAERKIAAVDARLANLQTDIQGLKDSALAEEESEHERTRQETAAELAKIRARAEQEIASAGKAASMDLKRYMVELAVGGAGEKIRARMNPAAQSALLNGFMRNLNETAQARRT